jgi:hypothetical protein
MTPAPISERLVYSTTAYRNLTPAHFTISKLGTTEEHPITEAQWDRCFKDPAEKTNVWKEVTNAS